jgi:predicted O-methyltransferase YrrM
MSIFNDILAIDQGPVRYGLSGNGHLKMELHNFPLSIKEVEFEYIRNLIIDNNLQRGFEVATAFGISALAATMGFKKTGGKLISMDAYVEEKLDSANMYENRQPEFNQEADGFKSALYLADHFGVAEHVDFAIGWSPQDVPDAVKICHGGEKLDYAFIDAGHFSYQIIADTQAIAPFFGDRGVVLYHDVYETFTDEVRSVIKDCFGDDVEIVIPFPDGENLGAVMVNR